MRDAGYGPDKRLKIKVSTRNVAPYRDLAVIMIEQLRHIYIDGELELIDSAVYFNQPRQPSHEPDAGEIYACVRDARTRAIAPAERSLIQRKSIQGSGV